MLFKQEVHHRIKERVTGRDERSGRLAFGAKVFLVEGDPFVSLQDRRALANHPVAMADERRDMADFVTKRFAPMDAAAKLLERPEEEGTDVVRLQAPSLSTLHLVANVADARRIKPLVDERSVLDERPKLFGVEFAIHNLVELGFIRRIVSVTDCPDEQIPERLIAKDLTQHVKHGTAKAFALGP